MRPVLFELGPLTVHAYGVLIALAGLAAWLVARRVLRERTGTGEAAGALVLAAVLGGFLGARVYYAVEHLGEPVGDLLGSAGFTWYGGALGGGLAVLLVARWHRLALADVLTVAAVALPIAYAIGRIGCQLAGDGTYGIPSELPWAMAYPNGEDPTTDRVHPTPVYETLASLALFAGLWRLRHRAAPAQLFGAYLALAGLERFLVELLRRNDDVVGPLSQPQVFAVASMIAGVALLAGRHHVGAPRPAHELSA